MQKSLDVSKKYLYLCSTTQDLPALLSCIRFLVWLLFNLIVWFMESRLFAAHQTFLVQVRSEFEFYRNCLVASEVGLSDVYRLMRRFYSLGRVVDDFQAKISRGAFMNITLGEWRIFVVCARYLIEGESVTKSASLFSALSCEDIEAFKSI